MRDERGKRKSFTAKLAKSAKEEQSLTAENANPRRKAKSFTAKKTIIRSRAKPEGREGTAPKMAYR